MIFGGNLSRGYLIMAVREARWSKLSLAEGDTYAALNRLCWAWRYLTLAERAGGAPEHATAGLLRSQERASAAVASVQRAFCSCWPARYAYVRHELEARG